MVDARVILVKYESIATESHAQLRWSKKILPKKKQTLSTEKLKRE